MLFRYRHVRAKLITYLELDEDGYELRQIWKFNDQYIASNREDSIYDFWLVEGYIKISELDSGVKEVSSSEFELLWTEYCKGLLNEWEETKLKYPIGRKVLLRCFILKELL